MARGERKRELSLQLLGKCHLKKEKKKTLKDSKMKGKNKASLGILVWARFPRGCELRTVGSIVCACVRVLWFRVCLQKEDSKEQITKEEIEGSLGAGYLYR